ncbi:MAG TPA: hypothetical protein VF576_02460 [Rubricoccaceae bacterium]|jgi:hypothetical protein
MRPLALCLLLAAAVPRPDQAAVVSRSDAKLAVQLLSRRTAVVNLCEPCGETGVAPQPFGRASARPWGPDPSLWEVTVDGEPKDLAYLYVPLAFEGGTATYVNVALALGLPVSGVSPTLTVPAAPDE